MRLPCTVMCRIKSPLVLLSHLATPLVCLFVYRHRSTTRGWQQRFMTPSTPSSEREREREREICENEYCGDVWWRMVLGLRARVSKMGEGNTLSGVVRRNKNPNSVNGCIKKLCELRTIVSGKRNSRRVRMRRWRIDKMIHFLLANGVWKMGCIVTC